MPVLILIVAIILIALATVFLLANRQRAATGVLRRETVKRDEGSKAPLAEELASTELEVSPEKIQPETRFREDLDADSLDLYELVMELEDRYEIRVSEEEAAEIETVGDAVDFVCARVPDDARVLESEGEGATR